MELKNTIAAMVDSNYKARFAAEYWQTKIRYDKLHDIITSYDAGTLNFELTCNISNLRAQARCMGQYLYELEVRAKIEDIDLNALGQEMSKYQVDIVTNQIFYAPDLTQKNLDFEFIKQEKYN